MVPPSLADVYYFQGYDFSFCSFTLAPSINICELTLCFWVKFDFGAALWEWKQYQHFDSTK